MYPNGDYDFSSYDSDGGEFIHYECPECHDTIAQSETTAQAFWDGETKENVLARYFQKWLDLEDKSNGFEFVELAKEILPDLEDKTLSKAFNTWQKGCVDIERQAKAKDAFIKLAIETLAPVSA